MQSNFFHSTSWQQSVRPLMITTAFNRHQAISKCSHHHQNDAVLDVIVIALTTEMTAILYSLSTGTVSVDMFLSPSGEVFDDELAVDR